MIAAAAVAEREAADSAVEEAEARSKQVGAPKVSARSSKATASAVGSMQATPV